MYIKIDNVSKQYPTKTGLFTALSDVSLEVEKGEFVCLLGFSGCGKSTLLNILAGFEHPTSGAVSIDGQVIQKPSPRYVTIFQQYGLLPWRTVLGNVQLGLESQGMSRNECKETARHYLSLVGLDNKENHYPAQLSGGQMQRVSIARSLAVKPEVLFMDEPFGALDPIIRNRLQADLLRIVKQTGCTVIFVTHDIEEAVFLSNRIVVMSPNPGRITHVIPNKLAYPRERSSATFSELRNFVYEELLSIEHEKEVDYVI